MVFHDQGFNSLLMRKAGLYLNQKVDVQLRHLHEKFENDIRNKYTMLCSCGILQKCRQQKLQQPSPFLSPLFPDSKATYNDTLMGDLQVRPELGNVAFGSGLQGWGFGIERFAKILSIKNGTAPWPQENVSRFERLFC